MTEREIELLGFEKQIVEDEDTFHYYTYDVTNGLSFISNSNDDVENDEWFVEIFETAEPIRFHKFEQVQSLINTLEKAKVK